MHFCSHMHTHGQSASQALKNINSHAKAIQSIIIIVILKSTIKLFKTMNPNFLLKNNLEWFCLHLEFANLVIKSSISIFPNISRSMDII